MSDFRTQFEHSFAKRAVAIERLPMCDVDGRFIVEQTPEGEKPRINYCFAQQEPVIADILRATATCGVQLHTIFADAQGRETPVKGAKPGQYAMTIREDAGGTWTIDPHLRKF